MKTETMYAVERYSQRRGWYDMGQWFKTRFRAERYIAGWRDGESMRVVAKSVGPSVGGFTVLL